MSDFDGDNLELWEKYAAGDRVAYERLVEQYLPLVKITVSRMSVNIPAFIDREELYSAGCVGLLEAIEKYDYKRGEAKFSTYATSRVRGAVIDELRRHDILGRVTRDRVNRISQAEQELNNRGIAASDEEIADEAGLTMEEYWDAECGKQATKMVSLHSRSRGEGDGEEIGDAAFAEILSIYRRDDFPGREMEMAEIVEMIYKMLDEKEQLLVVLYYNEELTLKEIGEVMQITESRVCQIHSAMVAKIKREMVRRGIYM